MDDLIIAEPYTNAELTAMYNESYIQSLVQAVQIQLDSVAQSRNYDNIFTACTYVTSSNARFAADAVACVAWRDAVWAYCYNILAEVYAGTHAIPTAEELVAGMPAIGW